MAEYKKYNAKERVLVLAHIKKNMVWKPIEQYLEEVDPQKRLLYEGGLSRFRNTGVLPETVECVQKKGEV